MKTSKSHHNQENLPRIKNVSYDALVDDLVGLNWRAVKTLAVAFSSPRSLVEAAWSEDWHGRYTPSFRLWFTLIAILFFFQFFWAGETSALIGIYASQIEASGVELPDGVSMRDASMYYARINFGIIPFTSVLCLFAVGIFYRAWGEVVPLVVRVRHVFSVIIPGTALALPVFWLMGVADEGQTILVLALSWLLPVPMNMWTAYRGVFAQFSLWNRLWRSAALSFTLLVSMLVNAFLAAYLSGYWISVVHNQ